MPRHLPVLVACVFAAGVLDASAQAARTSLSVRPFLPSTVAGTVSGVVMDDGGQSVAGVSVLAMGTVLAVATTDAVGRFILPLPAGDYVLRAAREGYISTYREPVRVDGNTTLERIIRIVRAGAFAEQGSAVQVDQDAAEDAPDRSHGHGEMAWKLRHLGRTVLRSDAGVWRPESETRDLAPASPWQWTMEPQARRAAAFLSETDFTGEVNFLTTSSVAQYDAWPGAWPRGLAYVMVGAPVGHRGDWTARAALTGGELSSWTLAADYTSRAEQPQAFRLSASFSSQSFALEPESTRLVVEPRAVGSLAAGNVSRLTEWLAADYGVRIDRYDYLAQPLLVSPEAGATVAISPDTRLRLRTSVRRLAPGSEQFLPPSSSGPWLPPERTFSSLTEDAPLVSERIGSFSVGVERTFGVGETPERTVSVTWFEQTTAGQLGTLFGVNEASAVGHYHVVPLGDASVRGWKFELGGQLSEHVSGRIGYAGAVGTWMTPADPDIVSVSRVAPSAVRRDTERLHDVTTSLIIAVPDTNTRVTLGYRVNTAFVSDHQRPKPGLGGRFSIELRQGLPYQPLDDGRLNVLVAVRTLLRDIDDLGSFYDELLTVRPPLRVTGGLQLGF